MSTSGGVWKALQRGIGQGKIGLEAFRHIVNDQRFHDLPGCLETPKPTGLREDAEFSTVRFHLVFPRPVATLRPQSDLLVLRL